MPRDEQETYIHRLGELDTAGNSSRCGCLHKPHSSRTNSHKRMPKQGMRLTVSWCRSLRWLERLMGHPQKWSGANYVDNVLKNGGLVISSTSAMARGY